MISILGLFDETKNLESTMLENSGRNNKYIKNINVLPEFDCPKEGSLAHDRDIDIVKWYYDNKSLSKNFLTISDESVKKVFKIFCKENNINVSWDFIKEVLSDVHAITASLKNKYKRIRPKNLLIIEDEKYSDVIDYNSYSFPSGHATIAYFLSELLSHFYPSCKKDFKNLAELIGQSRIENCLHYPSDVLHGQLLGEMLSSLFLKNENTERQLCHLKIKKKDRKNTVSKLIEYSSAKNISIKNLATLMSEFMASGDINSNFNELKNSCLNFLSGYPVQDCTRNIAIQDFLNLLIVATKLGKINNIFNYVSMHKLINEKNLQKNFKPGMIRYFNAMDSGYEYSKPANIINHVDITSSIDNPFLKYLIFDWIKPFCDGNKIVGLVCLLVETNYDFEKCITFLDKSADITISLKEKHENIDNIFKSK
jgi:hypothetical protein